MRIIYTILTLLITETVYSAELPNIVCQEIIRETLLPLTWEALGDSKVKSLYKFTNNNLYLSSPIREEYLYNKVTKIEPGRYQAGYKTILFKGLAFKDATVTHYDDVAIVISKLQCTKI